MWNTREYTAPPPGQWTAWHGAHADAQLREAIETVQARQTSELLNHPSHGWLASVPPAQVVYPLCGPATPDDLDELLSKVWQRPGFFLTHPLVIAAFGRECARRGTHPASVDLFGARCIAWRGTPLIPSDTVPLVNGKGKVLLLCAGEAHPAPPVRASGNCRSAIATYLLSLHRSLAGRAPDALAVLEDVEIGRYHAYPDNYKGAAMPSADCALAYETFFVQKTATPT